MVWSWGWVMANAVVESAGKPAIRHADHSAEWPHPPAAPGWMAWTPHAAVLWALAYGLVRVWWAIHGAPGSGPMHLDLIVFTGWGAVGLCAAAALVAFGLRTAPWNWPLLVAGWAVCAAHLAACPILLLDLVGALLPGVGVAFDPKAFASRAACLIEGILVGAVAVAYRRRWHSACLFCGRSGVSARLTQPPRWAWWAAYAAVAGCLTRLGAQASIGFGVMQRPPRVTRLAFEIESLVFEAAFLLAGTVLPLALVHAWGRVLPRWVRLLAGRRVPRWLPLGPAFAISTLMTVYFGLTLVKLAADTLSGAWRQSFGILPLAFFWVAVPAYWIWGVGLGIAAISYYRITRPPCKACGRL